MSSRAASPAYRIETKRLVIRGWNPADAPLLKIAVDDSAEHLRPWMPWVPETPEPLADIVERLRMFRGKFDLDADYVYGVFDPTETEVWGGTGLHTRVGHGGLEIGYWVHVDHVNAGLATELAGALTRVAMEIHGVTRIHIMCDPENVASAAVPRKLGYTREAVLRDRFVLPGGRLRDTEVWSLFRPDYREAAASRVEFRAFDAAGDAISCRFRERPA